MPSPGRQRGGGSKSGQSGPRGGRRASSEVREMADLNKTEIYIFASLVFLTLFFGIYPEPLLNTIDISVSNLIDNYQKDLNLNLVQANN